MNDQSPQSPYITLYSEALLPTEWGDFYTKVYRDVEGQEHMAIYQGELSGEEPTLVRVHSACFTGEALSSLKCDCKAQLERALQEINRAGRGVVVYLFQEGRGIGLGNKIKAYALQAQGFDTVDANTALGFEEDARRYEGAVAILQDLGVSQVRLMTNNPLKVEALERAGLKVADRVAIEVGRNEVNSAYLDTKRDRMRHMLSSEGG
jgi:GTP cyclohydrolase II